MSGPCLGQYRAVLGCGLLLCLVLSACGREESLPSSPTSVPSTTPVAPTPSSPTVPTLTATPFPPTPTRNPHGVWTNEPALLQGRAAHAVVSTESAIYVLGGTNESGQPILTVERFDGQTWINETMLPGDGLNAPTAVVLDNQIYVVGGFNTTTNVPDGRVQVYDLATQTWHEVAPLPAPRGGHASVVLDGRIHVFGGGNSVSTLDDHYMYDPTTDTWSNLAPLPRAEGSPAGVVFGNQIYAIGGRSGFSDFGEVYIYDAAADSWYEGPAVEPHGTAGAVVYCQTIYLIGGESQAQRETLATVFRLGANQTAWELATPMPTARSFARAVLFQEAIYVVGGSTTFGSSHASPGSTTVERFQLDCRDN